MELLRYHAARGFEDDLNPVFRNREMLGILDTYLGKAGGHEQEKQQGDFADHTQPTPTDLVCSIYMCGQKRFCAPPKFFSLVRMIHVLLR